MTTTWRRLRLSLDLLLQRRQSLYLAVDAMILLGVLVGILAEEDVDSFYGAVLLPILVLGIPILSDAVALERRAGSLDLALSSSGASLYFERRVGLFSMVMAAQGFLVLVAIRMTAGSFLLAPALVQTAVTCALLGAAVLFWAVRLRGPGAVAFATSLTVAALGPWIFKVPIHRFIMSLDEVVDWSMRNLVLALAALILYLYARRRLGRPESML